ncbi:uncharacterized protein N7506_005738 [Penicillium brevicompactum]|uniref:uncharacterized protein n=1 Tax=Penicillium brevicompactum TaxID=5074 RepID=UPI0025409CA7|nr:uncharacterized protein N7506_005738 [Penicillium brevicompactum]KAJ5335802.1 hypothetical protein N7506_005738 [Penicillium brevicompactum]
MKWPLKIEGFDVKRTLCFPPLHGIASVLHGRPPAWTASRMDGLPHGRPPAWMASRMDGLPHGRPPAWMASRMDGLPHGRPPAWTASRMDGLPHGPTTFSEFMELLRI